MPPLLIRATIHFRSVGPLELSTPPDTTLNGVQPCHPMMPLSAVAMTQVVTVADAAGGAGDAGEAVVPVVGIDVGGEAVGLGIAGDVAVEVVGNGADGTKCANTTSGPPRFSCQETVKSIKLRSFV